MRTWADRIIIRRGDITDMEVDAIVNAANTDLILGGGVAGAIRQKGGDHIQEECNSIGPIAVGEAAITRAGKLKSKHVIHAAGMHQGGTVTEKSLRDSTKNSLLRADEHAVKTIAFPAIGTGVGHSPLDECARVMIDTVLEYVNGEKTCIDTIYFVLFDDKSFRIFDQYAKARCKQ